MIALITNVWERLAQGVDLVLKAYLHVVDPRHVVTIFLVLNLMASLMAWRVTSSWNDWYTVSGYWATLTGFLVAISELYRARTTAEQIREAVGREASKQKRKSHRDLLDRAKLAFHLAKVHIGGYDWRPAQTRLSELIELMIQMVSLDSAGSERFRELFSLFGQVMESVAVQTPGRKGSFDNVQWMKIQMTTQKCLESEIAFADREEADHAS